MIPRKVRICLYESIHRSGVAWWVEAESKRHRMGNGRYLMDCTVISGTRLTPSKSFASVLASSVRLGLACCGETTLVFVSDAKSTPDVSPLGRQCRRLARQPTRCRLLLGHACPTSSSVGGGGDGTDPDVAHPSRGEDVVDSVADGRADCRHCRCRAAEEGVSCRSCRRGT
jgi:hypothetical protein